MNSRSRNSDVLPASVSVVIIFLNEDRYLGDAIDSVINQSFTDWELILVDDGSTEPATRIAKDYAARYPRNIRYADHPGHANRGSSASRNLGISLSQAKYIAFIDADDVWLPDKLNEQIQIMNLNPEVGMVYGRTCYWHSWHSDPSRSDFQPRLGVTAETIHYPPTLLPKYIKGSAAVPCTCSIFARRSVVEEIGGFEGSFPDMYDDQVFYAKMSLHAPIFVSESCWDLYRQRKESMTAQALKSQEAIRSRRRFLRWLMEHLERQEINDRDVWEAVLRAAWEIDFDFEKYKSAKTIRRIWRVKKMLLRLEEKCLPRIFRRWIWTRRIG